MTTKNKLPPPPPGNQRAVKHGGAAAVKAIQHGAEFSGLAAIQEQVVRDELANQGRAYLVEKNAVRLQTAADLYFPAALAAAQAGDQAKADGYIKMYGWLAAAALRAWAQVKADGEKDRGKGAAAVIDYYRGKEGADDRDS